MKASMASFAVLTREQALLDALTTTLVAPSVITVDDYANLLDLVRKPTVVGMVLDARALSGNIESKLARLRNDAPLLKILFVADELSAKLLNELQPLHVEIVARPLPPEGLALFVERTLAAGRLPSARVDACISQLASTYRLNGKEVSLFSVVLDNETAEAARARLGLDEVVYARTMRRLLKKCHMRNADRLAKNVLRDALLSTYA